MYISPCPHGFWVVTGLPGLPGVAGCPGVPYTPGMNSRRVEVSLSVSQWELLERVRGFESRASFVKRALESALSESPRGAASPVERAPGALPSVARSATPTRAPALGSASGSGVGVTLPTQAGSASSRASVAGALAGALEEAEAVSLRQGFDGGPFRHGPKRDVRPVPKRGKE